MVSNGWHPFQGGVTHFGGSMTHAEELRKMTEEQLLEAIYQLCANAATCPTCFFKNGKERLEMWLKLEVNG